MLVSQCFPHKSSFYVDTCYEEPSALLHSSSVVSSEWGISPFIQLYTWVIKSVILPIISIHTISDSIPTFSKRQIIASLLCALSFITKSQYSSELFCLMLPSMKRVRVSHFFQQSHLFCPVLSPKNCLSSWRIIFVYAL